MPRPPSDNDTQTALRIPGTWLTRADRLVALVAQPGVSVTRTDVLRVAMALGLDLLERKKREAKHGE